MFQEFYKKKKKGKEVEYNIIDIQVWRTQISNINVGVEVIEYQKQFLQK